MNSEAWRAALGGVAETSYCWSFLVRPQAGVAELADAPDSKSGFPEGKWGFDSPLRH
jgi:hypothetical protein